MNWKYIKDNYPKAWNSLCEYHENEVVGLIDHPYVWDQDNLAPSSWELRHLYDFFEIHEIYISMIHRDSLNSIPPYQWKIRGDISEGFKTRQQAEEAAFLKAFEILETKLNK